MGYVKFVYRKGSENDSDALNKWKDPADLTEESIIDNPILKQNLKIMMPKFLKKNVRIYVRV
jgi:hypothetical protein